MRNISCPAQQDLGSASALEDGATGLLQSTMNEGGCSDDTEIFKPRSDERSYRRIVLQNALQVLLISDRETDKAAASVDVRVGSFSDPEELQGLAHFLEHALFFSSEKYPDEGSFRRFVVEHGGSENAYTGGENTNYHFEVGVDHLPEALDRFAQFFICPLFTEDATSREIRAVDSENSKNLKSDVWRMSQLERHMSSKEHPYHKFSAGNLETLETAPKAKGVDVRQEMLRFYEEHYSSNLMSLAIYGKETLDELQTLAEEKFSAVKNSNKNAVRFLGQPFSPDHLQILVRAVPVADGHTLKLVWPVTPSQQNYREAPSRYWKHLIEHKATGSLSALFKQLGWANFVSAWGSVTCSPVSGFFNVEMDLTDVGQEHMEELVDFIFQYLAILRKEGIAKWIFEEHKALSHMKFHYQEKGDPITYVTSLSERMRLYPPQDWLAAGLMRNFDPDVLSRAIHEMTPETVRIFWHSKQFQQDLAAAEVEPWYGTQFTSKKIDQVLVKQWRSPEVDPRLHLPQPNPFIPTDFSLVSDADWKTQFPVVLKNTRMSRLWYKLDSKFRKPKASITLHFHCPETNVSPEACALTWIFSVLLNDHLDAYANNAVVAGLGYQIASTSSGLWISSTGFNHKLISLITTIVEVIVKFEVNEDRFKVIKERVLRGCVNVRFQQPHQQARYHRDSLLRHKRWHVDDLMEVIPHLEPEDLRKMFPRCLSRVFVESFAAGNITSKEAEALMDHVESTLISGLTLRAKPAFASQLVMTQQRVVRLEDGADFIYPSVGLNPEDENSALRFYLQIAQDDTRTNVLLDLLALAMDEATWHQLRTVQQLGYLVWVTRTNDYSVRGIEFCIQSAVRDPEFLEERVEAFLEEYKAILENLSEEEFRKHVDTLIKMKQEKHKSFYEETRFFYREIDDGTLQFERGLKEAIALQTVEKQALVDFYRRHVQRDAPQRRKLSLRVYGSHHLEEYKALKQTACSDHGGRKEPDEPEVSVAEDKDVEGCVVKPEEGWNIKHRNRAQLIDDIYAFKRSQSLYSCLWGGSHLEARA